MEPPDALAIQPLQPRPDPSSESYRHGADDTVASAQYRNEEMQVIAPKTVKTLNDLEGKTVSVDLPNGGTFVTALTVFERLGIKANFVYIEQRIAMEEVENG